MESCCDISLVESVNSDLSTFGADEDDENQFGSGIFKKTVRRFDSPLCYIG